MAPDVAKLQMHLATLSQLLAGEYIAAGARLRIDRAAASAFLAFIESQHLAWYLTELVDEAGLRDVFDPAHLERVERATCERRAQQSAVLEEMHRVWPRFEKHRIDVTLLKGAYLAERFFGGPRKRGFLDLDLLVRREQLAEAEDVLGALGYRRLSTILGSRRLTTRFTHGLDFERDGLRLDLHWSLGAHVSYRIDYDRVWRARTAFVVDGREHEVLSEEDAFFFHLVSLFEDIERGAGRVRSFVDVHAMARDFDPRVDWHEFWRRRRQERTARPCQAVLALLFVLFDCEERAPRLAESIASTLSILRRQPTAEVAALVAGPEGSVQNKLWALRQYECARALSVGWWMVTLPFRLAVYHPGKLARVRRRGAALLRRAESLRADRDQR